MADISRAVDPAPVRAVLFDAANTLLQVDYAAIVAHLRTRGHHVTEAAATEAERRGRIRLDQERAGEPTPGVRGAEGRYLRYLLDRLGLRDEKEERSVVTAICRGAPPTAQDRLA